MENDKAQGIEGDLLVILRHGPYGTSWLREGLDAALVAAAFGRRVTLLFMGEGVTALVPAQTSGPLGQKGTSPTIEMLEMYDIDILLVEATALARFGLRAEGLMLPARAVEAEELSELASTHSLVLTF